MVKFDPDQMKIYKINSRIYKKFIQLHIQNQQITMQKNFIRLIVSTNDKKSSINFNYNYK
ncbi:hypothetical protein BBD39_08645 [Arsenophonus endosymbiont of Bemisia tabaci Asia II 3]|nr:hypothetical protein BBD39_08645 [Arsenophonus endosymbiont of Bemisia tabaci Asia II 3]